MTIALSGSRPGTDLDVRPAIVVGLGARASASSHDILALVHATLAENAFGVADIAFCVTHPDKLDHRGLRAVAMALGVPLVAAEEAAFSRMVPNPSATVERLTGRSSVAEAAASAFGPLLCEKSRSANATCALSRLSARYWPSISSAASTLSASRAGP